MAGESCSFCGISYKRFRGPSGMTWADAQQVQWDRSKGNASRGDYSTPVTRAAVLGRLREWKQAEWDEHQRLCGEYAALETLRAVGQGALAEQGQWGALDEVVESIEAIELELGIREEAPF